ncbi:helix-turn-helix domain-containing protein [Pseudomonas asplenii]|uniref:helix-turn-helix domain-containing protein n=1 Tax=Pseudomonas asplenii TaxID=53407 RepID=UPI0003701129|nr:AraC family transcriptional regulator [Pseudomonas fuscovaginae]
MMNPLENLIVHLVSRLIDLTVIRMLRAWLRQSAAPGWFGGLSDARAARVPRVIHGSPGQQWRIDVLAEIAGMSRSNFCERFSALVGRSPLRYQNEGRLTLAKKGGLVAMIGPMMAILQLFCL